MWPAALDAQAQVADPLAWLSLGPERGGRVTTVAGVKDRPHLFYAGTVGGGILRTEDAGISWRSISTKSFGSASVGALAVSPADPKTIYAGMGESTQRLYMSSIGDGVYKSTDGGTTWKHVGLTATRRIGSILVNPARPDTVYVAAMGNSWSPSPDRGIFKSTDGGATWKRIFYVNATTSAVDLAADPRNPRTLYVSTWDNIRKPWYLGSGGPGSGIFKSLDGGSSWRRLTRGLPAAMGRIGIAVSPVDGRRLYAIVEAAEQDGGLYVSSDAGESWKLVNRSRDLWTRPWYYMRIVPHPTRRDTIFLPSLSLWRSTDAGKTYKEIATPHGDNHALWLNPGNPAIMVEGNDGGATVSLNGGESWSTLYNQRTGQFYRVATAGSSPYYVLGAQQDWGSIAVRRRRDLGGTAGANAFEVGGGEAGYIAADPFDPNVIYAGSEMGLITRFDRRTNLATVINPFPLFPEGQDPKELRYRFQVNAPIVASAHTPGTVYHAAQLVLRSRDRGQTWEEASPDLTRNEPDKQGRGSGPFANERIDAHNVIASLDESPIDGNILWAGTDDGLVQVTSDGGRHWANVTPPAAGGGEVSTISASPHDRRQAFAAITRHGLGDMRPHVFRTGDLGRTWTDISAGLPQTTYARAIREDPARRGLLFAGTEQGVFVSFDNGGRWRELSPTLPTTPVTGISVADDELVISTEGTGLWVLPGLPTLRQLAWDSPRDTRLFRPAAPILTEGGVGHEIGDRSSARTFAGIDIWASEADLASGREIAIDILAADGSLVRKLGRYRAGKPEGDRAGTLLKPGLNRLLWNLRRDDPEAKVPGTRDGEIGGYKVLPGLYQVRLTAPAGSEVQPLRILRNPRQAAADPASLARKEALLKRLVGLFETIAAAANRAEAERKDAAASGKPGEAQRAARLAAWGERVVSRKLESPNDRVNYGGGLLYDVGTLYDFADSSETPLGAALFEMAGDLERRWEALERAKP